MSRILGLGGSDHDVHACVVEDGRVLVAIEEERLSRHKYGIGGNLLDGLARRYCLESTGIEPGEFDAIVVDEILPPTARLGVRKRSRSIDHHLAHAAAAWFPSGFEEGAVLVVDNAGGLRREGGREGLQATSWYRGEGDRIDLCGRVLSDNWSEGPSVLGQPYQRGDGDHSIGHLYKKVSGALGFRFELPDAGSPGFFFPEDGVTMGLASYGDGRYVDELWEFAGLGEEGRYTLDLCSGRLDSLLESWLPPDADFDRRAAVAAAVQEVTTRLLAHLAQHAMEVAGTRNLCLSGGVAMNSVANGELLRRTSVENLYVPPMPADNGTAFGACLWTAARGESPPATVWSVYTGRSYSEEQVAEALAELPAERYRVEAPPVEELLREVCRGLASGQVVGWFEGGSECGRRALGHRSFLGDARSAEVRDRINRDVKHRQAFRPLAPVVPAELAAEWFAVSAPSPYMQLVHPVPPSRREELAGVTHVDGTARLQTLEREEHPRLHALLLEFGAATGVPVLINTSMNVRGEPMVESPAEAVRCLGNTGLDALVLERHLVVKR